MDTQAIEDLNVLLKDELSAVEFYTKALDKLQGEENRSSLKDSLQSHQTRAAKLSEKIKQLGGQADTTQTLGAILTKFVMDGAAAMNDHALLIALSEAEGGWSSDYEWRLVSMHGAYRNLVKDELWPEQKRTEELMRERENSANKGLWPATPGAKDI